MPEAEASLRSSIDRRVNTSLKGTWLKNNQTKSRKRWWQKCSCYCEKCTTVKLCIPRHWAARFCNNFWERQKSVGTNSTSTIRGGCVASKQTSEKRNVRRLVKYESKILISEVPTLWNSRTDLQKRTARQERCAHEDAWRLVKNIFLAHKGRQSYSGFCWPRSQHATPRKDSLR